jgi:cytochrome d ubiquinol oxidase subunit II
MTLWEAASAPKSLMFVFVGTVVVVPVIVAYSAFSYRVFRGKSTSLEYD